MRKLVSAAFAAILLLIGVCFIAPVKTAAQAATVTAVPSVDLKRYSGKWYEIARIPNRFQKKCVGNVTADYALDAEGNVQVTNRCLEKNGKLSEATGKAKVEDKATNAKLEVRFAPGFLSFIPMVWGDYWIIDLDPNYQYSVVGNPDRKYLWILSRTPTLDDATYQQILRRTEKMGYDPNKLVKTPQDVKTLKGSVINTQ
jgi:apolipoprotein D and lipocalin family protein